MLRQGLRHVGVVNAVGAASRASRAVQAVQASCGLHGLSADCNGKLEKVTGCVTGGQSLGVLGMRMLALLEYRCSFTLSGRCCC